MTNTAIRVEIESEIGTSYKPARVLVYNGDELIQEVTAKIEPKQGADGGYYPCITLTKVSNP